MRRFCQVLFFSTLLRDNTDLIIKRANPGNPYTFKPRFILLFSDSNKMVVVWKNGYEGW